MKNAIVHVGVVCGLGLGCSSDITNVSTDDGLLTTNAAEAADGRAALQLGDTGPEVAAASEYFRAYGYFENDPLRQKYPNYFAIAGSAPPDDSVFGEELERALIAYQARNGIPVTGTLDSQTQDMLQTPRCGVPDELSILPLTDRDSNPEVDKWAPQISPQLVINWRTDHSVTYSVDAIPATFRDGTGASWTQGNFNAAISTAFSRWTIRVSTLLSHVTFQKIASGADIRVRFASFSLDTPPSAALADADGATIRFNTDVRWDNAVTFDEYDLQSVAAHEMGHSIGIGHSRIEDPGVARAVMWSGIGTATKRSDLTLDDLQALAISPYNDWDLVAGTNDAIDVGSSVQGGNEHTWKVGPGANADGYDVYNWNESLGWVNTSGGGVRIDVVANRPWVVTSAGRARSYNGASWVDRGDCNFIDIGGSSTGVIWALGGTVDGNGNYAVYRYDGATGTGCTVGSGGWLLESTGRARYIDVAPDGGPWVVSNSGNVYHRAGVSGANPTGTHWTTYGGPALDIGVGPEEFGGAESIWITGHPSSDNHIYLLNVQASNDSNGDGDFNDGGDTLARNQWVRPANGGNATFITVGRDAMPWAVLAANSSTWRRRP